MSIRLQALPLLVLAGSLSACNCGDDGLKKVRDGAIEILSPADGDTAASMVTFTARATSSGGLQWLALKVGSKEIATCNPGDDNTTIDCTKEFSVPDFVSEAVNNAITLTALARDGGGDLIEKSVTIVAAPLTVKFVKPSAPAGGTATLRGETALEVAVDSLMTVQAVAVTVDDKPEPLAQWRAVPYKTLVKWASVLGTGDHVLKAQARDVNGAVARAELKVKVSCGSDNECATGTRCCTDTGRCNPIVGAGADCDCEHPCPYDQGCFPGTCGTLPRKCRPGCFPGGSQRGQYADRCGSESQGATSVPAYCSALPPSEATAQNKGGACAPMDAVGPTNAMCSITRQDCPDAPLDKNSPVSPTNPLIKYSCVPASPKGNICLPAGSIPESGTGCEYDTCGDTAKACQKGLLCVTLIDQSGSPLGPATCRKQCANPDPLGGVFGGSPECPSGQYCGGLLGPGLEEFPTGSCSKPGL